MRAVVVGSGFGGLAAAIRLAAAGHEVTVLERRDAIGGRAYQYRVGGFLFDGGPTVLTAPHTFEDLFALAGERLEDHVDLMPIDPFYRVFDPEGRSFDFHSDPDALAAEVGARSPGDLEGFLTLRRRIAGIFDAFHPYTERHLMELPVMLRMLPYLLRHRAVLDVQRLVDSSIRDPFLRQALAFHPLLIGGDPRRTPALYALIVEFERRWGVHYARGGTGALVAALGGLLERLGGRIRVDAEVDRILVRDGAAVGVRLASGEEVAADVVVSNADAVHTQEHLLREARRPLGGDLSGLGRQPSMSLHVVYLGADRSWPDTALAHHSMLMPRRWRPALDRVFRPRRGGTVAEALSAEDLFMYVHLPTRTDPSIAPPGCDSMYVLVAAPALPRRDRGEAAEAAQARRVRDLAVETLEARFLPGLAGSIIAEHAIGPAHFRDVLRTPRGAAFSLQPTLFQSGWFRPHHRSHAARGVYLVGAGTHPGAGVPAVLASAKIAAALIAEREGAVPGAAPDPTAVA